MGVHSGKFGAINNRNMVRNWTLEDTSTSQRVVHSGSRVGSFRLPGIKDWTGTFDAYHPKTANIAEVVMPGETFTFTGYTAPTDGQSGSTGVTYEGLAIVESIAITWDFTGGTPLSYVTNFACADGSALTLNPSGAFVEDLSPDVPQSICPLLIEIVAPAVDPVDWTNSEWANCTTATLTITSDIQTFVNSSTDCNTGRKAGPYDWTLTVTEQNEDQSFAQITSAQIGANYGIRLYSEDTNGDGTPDDYWLLEWGHLESYTGLTVDRETGAIIEKTANFAMSGFEDSLDLLGRIAKPGETTGTPWWGRDLV